MNHEGLGAGRACAEIAAASAALALAQVNQNQVEAAYQRSDLLDLRRTLKQTWGNWCYQEVAPAEEFASV